MIQLNTEYYVMRNTCFSFQSYSESLDKKVEKPRKKFVLQNIYIILIQNVIRP